MVNSVEKAFRVLSAFGRRHQTLNLSQVASETGMDLSAAQRFTHTLTTLGYLRRQRDDSDKRNIFVARTAEGADFLEEFEQFIGEGEPVAGRIPAAA